VTDASITGVCDHDTRIATGWLEGWKPGIIVIENCIQRVTVQNLQEMLQKGADLRTLFDSQLELELDAAPI
jgi:hypothetical protein